MTAAAPGRILLVTADLMASSRIAGAARSLGHAVDTRTTATTSASLTGYDVALIDVQSCPDPAAAIARGREAVAGTGTVIAFGPHVWRERLEAAVAAGADAAATRGEVMEGLAGLLERVIGRAPHGAGPPDRDSPTA